MMLIAANRRRKLISLLFISFLFHTEALIHTISPNNARLRPLHATDNDPSPTLSRSAFFASLIAIPTAAHAASDAPKVSQTVEESVSGLIAGAALTAAKTLVKYPLDTATVRLQMRDSDYSIYDLVRLFRGSYRGVIPPLISNIPAGAVFFSVKDATKVALADTAWNSYVRTSIAVAVAQIPYWLVRNPSEVVKTRQQANIPGYDVGMIDAFAKVRRDAQSTSNQNTTGLEGFYSGYWENVLYAYPADVIKFICYDWFSRGRKNLSPAEGAVAGAAATAAAQFITTPLDVVRNRIMAQSSTEKGEQQSYLESLLQLAEQEGWKGLFAGASPRVGKALLSGAIQFATYEESKQTIAKLFEKNYKITR